MKGKRKDGEERGGGVGIDVVKGKGEKRKGKARARNCNNVAIDTLDFCFANFSFFSQKVFYAIHVCYIKVAQLT